MSLPCAFNRSTRSRSVTDICWYSLSSSLSSLSLFCSSPSSISCRYALANLKDGGVFVLHSRWCYIEENIECFLKEYAPDTLLICCFVSFFIVGLLVAVSTIAFRGETFIVDVFVPIKLYFLLTTNLRLRLRRRRRKRRFTPFPVSTRYGSHWIYYARWLESRPEL